MIVFYLFPLKFLEGNQSLQLFLSKCFYYLSNPYVCIFSNSDLNDLQDDRNFIILKTTWKWNLCFIFLYPSLEILNLHLNINKNFEQFWEIVMFFVTVYELYLALLKLSTISRIMCLKFEQITSRWEPCNFESAGTFILPLRP